MKKLSVLVLMATLIGCAPQEPTAKQVGDLLEKHPEILVNAIEKNPDVIMGAIQKAAQKGQEKARMAQAKSDEAKFEEEMKNPLSPDLSYKKVVLGNKDAPITIVKYTDFQCPFCTRGYQTLEDLQKEYGDKIKVVVKHLPLPMHPLARTASEMYEALALQDVKKAESFYHNLFENQSKITEAYLDEVAKKLGANMNKLKKDMASPEVKSVVAKDEEEARKYGFSGTPGFLVNGVSVRGAYPVPHFKKIIDRMLN